MERMALNVAIRKAVALTWLDGGQWSRGGCRLRRLVAHLEGGRATILGDDDVAIVEIIDPLDTGQFGDLVPHLDLDYFSYGAARIPQDSAVRPGGLTLEGHLHTSCEHRVRLEICHFTASVFP